MSKQRQKTDLVLALHEIGALKFGEFTYKSGATGPMYLDLRLFISHPKVMKQVAKLYAEILKDLKYDRLAGVAYAALPIAGAISLELNQPWIFMRKEGLVKGYGLKKALEGEYNEGETVVMIEDLVNRATSLLEAIPAIEAQGLKVHDAVVLLDYQKGGRETLESNGYKLHAFMTVREVVDIMFAEGKIDAEKHAQCIKFLEA
jgi:uridine monophosphate synthetase